MRQEATQFAPKDEIPRKLDAVRRKVSTGLPPGSGRAPPCDIQPFLRNPATSRPFTSNGSERSRAGAGQFDADDGLLRHVCRAST